MPPTHQPDFVGLFDTNGYSVDEIQDVFAPKLEYIRNITPSLEEVQKILIAFHMEFVIKHPFLAFFGFIFALPLIAGLAGVVFHLGHSCIPLVLWCIGFGAKGVAAGSLAAGWQSIYYGAIVPAGSIFARLLSFAMLGA